LLRKVLARVFAVHSCERSLGPDTESANDTTRGKHEKVGPVDAHEVDTRDVAEGLDETIVVLVDDERSATPLVHATTHFTFTRPGLLPLAFVELVSETKLYEASDSIFGRADGL
jgi:hypothetical protein